MPVSEAHKRARAKWDKAHMAVLTVKVTKQKALDFSAACEKLGVKRGQVLRAAIEDAIVQASSSEA